VLANETFYSAVIIAIFIFSDATPELNIKFGAGVCLMTSLVLLVLANLITNIVYIVLGHDKLKKQIKDQKLQRAEREALERAEDEARRLKEKLAEEEFSKMPEDKVDPSQIELNDQDASASNTFYEQSETKKFVEKGKKGSEKGGKSKKGDDNVSGKEFENLDKSEDNMIQLPDSKKKRRQKLDKK